MKRLDGKPKFYGFFECVDCGHREEIKSPRKKHCWKCNHPKKNKKPARKVMTEEERAEKKKNYEKGYRSREYVKEKARRVANERYWAGKCKPSKMPPEYHREKRKIPKHNLSHRMQNGMRLALKRKNLHKGGRSWEGLVGYTVLQLKEHLEKLFLPGMGWHNMAEWHIDHVKPKSKFNYTSTEDQEFLDCWALKNLQPLWARDNLIKKDKWEE